MAERTKIGMSLDEFMQRFDEQPFEIIDGKIYNLPIEPARHAIVRNNLFKHLLWYEKKLQYREVFARQLVLQLVEDDDVIRAAYYPDLIVTIEQSFYEEEYITHMPDLVVEVISPMDIYTDVNRKVDAYIEDGVKLIWIVDPQRQTVAVYQGTDSPTTLRTDNTLIGDSVLPDFEISVKAIFE